MTMLDMLCTYCGTDIKVHSKVDLGNSDNVSCAPCKALRAIHSPVQMSKKDADEFLKELDTILCNEELDEDDLYDWIYEETDTSPKCECGAVSAGVQYHGRWCPVYVDPMTRPDVLDDIDEIV